MRRLEELKHWVVRPLVVPVNVVSCARYRELLQCLGPVTTTGEEDEGTWRDQGSLKTV